MSLISDESRKPYIGHAEVGGKQGLICKMTEYKRMGIEHVKLYWRLKPKDFEHAVLIADQLGLEPFGHIDFGVLTVAEAFHLGLRNFEHIYTLYTSIETTRAERKELESTIREVYENGPGFHGFIMELILYIESKHPEKLDVLIEQLSNSGVSFSTTISLFAQEFGLYRFESNNRYNVDQKSRAKKAIRFLMARTIQMHNNGIAIRIGTDCKEGGKALIQELDLLKQIGLSMEDIVKISSYNGAKAIQKADLYGSVEVGKKANLVLYKKTLHDSFNFKDIHLVIKDGKPFH